MFGTNDRGTEEILMCFLTIIGIILPSILITRLERRAQILPTQIHVFVHKSDLLECYSCSLVATYFQVQTPPEHIFPVIG